MCGWKCWRFRMELRAFPAESHCVALSEHSCCQVDDRFWPLKQMREKKLKDPLWKLKIQINVPAFWKQPSKANWILLQKKLTKNLRILKKKRHPSFSLNQLSSSWLERSTLPRAPSFTCYGDDCLGGSTSKLLDAVSIPDSLEAQVVQAVEVIRSLGWMKFNELHRTQTFS